MAGLNLDILKNELNNVNDIKFRELSCNKQIITLVYTDTMCDSKSISEYIVSPLLNYQKKISNVDTVTKEIVLATPVDEVKTLREAVNYLFSGNVLLFFSFSERVIYCNARGFEKRNIEVPTTEAVVKGPREGFTEDIHDNTTSIRKRIKTSELKIEKFLIGEKSQTACNLLYVENNAPEDLISHIRDKINSLKDKKEYILYSNYLEEALKSKKTSFDTIGYTEKPDIAAQKLSEGRAVIILDGTSFVVFAPHFFLDNFQTTDDYTMNKYMANAGRLLRFISFIIATLLPGMYIALVTHHFKLIPTMFVFKIAMFRASVPIPSVLELLMMMFFFQIIREAGVRLPQPIGPTLSIVGALILGEAAVASGLASQITVVVVGLTSNSSYLIPKLYISIFFWNTFIVILSAMLGLPGFYVGFIIFVAHLSGLTTCGYPYLFPMGTRESFKYKDDVSRGSLDEISNNILSKGDGE